MLPARDGLAEHEAPDVGRAGMAHAVERGDDFLVHPLRPVAVRHYRCIQPRPVVRYHGCGERMDGLVYAQPFAPFTTGAGTPWVTSQANR